MMIEHTLSYDVVVIGGGQAALIAAISAKEKGASVALITKGKAGLGGSSVISDGVHSAIFSDGDSPEAFYNDIFNGGKQLSDKKLAKVLAEECTVRVRELEEKYGIHTNWEDSIITPGHSFARRVYAGKGLGRNITGPLRDFANKLEIEFIEHSELIDFIEDQGQVRGVIFLKDHKLFSLLASSTILATGGFGGLYTSSDNPRDVTGEGIGMAWQMGAELVDMEFVQYYPYRLLEPANVDVMTKIFGKGAFLVNDRNERFMESFPRKELETRDILSYEMYKQKKVLLDFTNVNQEVLEEWSPHIHRLNKKGYNGEWIMSPVQHYCMGGIKIDEWGRTSVPGLFACGECTGGIHGANRLGGGSLTESLVFGKRAGEMAAENKNNPPFKAPLKTKDKWHSTENPNIKEQEVIRKLKETMWTKVGIERTLESLSEAAVELEQQALELSEFKDRTSLSLYYKVSIAWATAKAASLRQESRGAHKVINASKENSEFVGNFVIKNKSITFEPCT